MVAVVLSYDFSFDAWGQYGNHTHRAIEKKQGCLACCSPGVSHRVGHDWVTERQKTYRSWWSDGSDCLKTPDKDFEGFALHSDMLEPKHGWESRCRESLPLLGILAYARLGSSTSSLWPAWARAVCSHYCSMAGGGILLCLLGKW